MSEEKTMTREQAHRFFAVECNQRVWQFLEKPDRSAEENDEMIHSAHASAWHWSKIGTAVNHQRGEWLLARVYTVLNMPESAEMHALKCYELTKEYASEMKDFDIAYGFECMARALEIAGNSEEAAQFLEQAEEAGERIAGPEDKKIWLADLRFGAKPEH